MKTIRELREAQGASQMQLAAAMGVTLHQVTDWETGMAEPTTSMATHADSLMPPHHRWRGLTTP
jgi:DNA-binding transcriptional regulator YiaG